MTATLFLSVFLLYILFMIGLSVWISRQQSSGEDFLLGNRKVPLILILGSTVATMVGTGSSMGAVAKGYSNGWAGAFYGLGGAIGILLLAKLFAHVRRFNFMTFAEEMSFYYGANRLIKGIIAVLILIASMGWLGAHIIGGGIYLSYITEIPEIYARIIIAAAFGIYVIIGGYLAVVWTDTIQALVLFVGFIIMAVMALSRIGGLEGLQIASSAEHMSFLSGTNLLPSISLAVAIMVGVLGTPSFRQRIYSADSPATVRKSFYSSGGLYLLFTFIPAIIGIAAFQLNNNLDPDFAFPFLIVEILPVAIGLLVLIAGLSASMSSASSDAIAAVAILLRDIFVLFTGKMPDKHKTVNYSRWGIFGITAVALIFTLFSDQIISYITGMISIVMSGMVVCCLMGKYWKRANWQGGLAALIGGSLTSILIMMHTPSLAFWGNPIIPALIGATFAGIIVSLLTPPNTISQEVALEILANERAEMEMTQE